MVVRLHCYVCHDVCNNRFLFADHKHLLFETLFPRFAAVLLPVLPASIPSPAEASRRTSGHMPGSREEIQDIAFSF